MALDEATNKERRRTLGNIRFIGELFKLSMLTETIMHNCILQLFRARTDEDSLESLCRLLTTIGKDLDHEKGKVNKKYCRLRIYALCTILFSRTDPWSFSFLI